MEREPTGGGGAMDVLEGVRDGTLGGPVTGAVRAGAARDGAAGVRRAPDGSSGMSFQPLNDAALTGVRPEAGPAGGGGGAGAATLAAAVEATVLKPPLIP